MSLWESWKQTLCHSGEAGTDKRILRPCGPPFASDLVVLRTGTAWRCLSRPPESVVFFTPSLSSGTSKAVFHKQTGNLSDGAAILSWELSSCPWFWSVLSPIVDSFFPLKICFYYFCICVCVCVGRSLWRSEKVVGSLEAGVTGSCEPLDSSVWVLT